MFTAVNRDINTPTLDFLHTAAYTAGIDFQHNWKERTWYVAGNAEFSNIKGKPISITSDTNLISTVFSATGCKISFSRFITHFSFRLRRYGKIWQIAARKRLQFETSVTLRSPGLEFNDIGYMRYSDVIHHGTWAWDIIYAIHSGSSIIFILIQITGCTGTFPANCCRQIHNTNFNSQFKNKWRINGQFQPAE